MKYGEQLDYRQEKSWLMGVGLGWGLWLAHLLLAGNDT